MVLPKRTDINVDLTSETNETAQALREAQILSFYVLN